MSFTAVLQLQYSYEYGNLNSLKNRSKWASAEISGDFPQLVELPLIKTHIGGCFQSIREAAVRRIFVKYREKQTWRSPFKVNQCENSKNSYFPKRVLRISLPFGLGASFVFVQVYRKVKNWNSLLFIKVCVILIVNTCSAAKKYVILTSSSWSKRTFSDFSKLIIQLTEAALQVFLGKSVLKICCKFKGDHACRSSISVKLHATLLKLHFSMDVFL